MANKGFFDKIASFEEAMRKFEEALEQSQQPGAGRPSARPPSRGPRQGQGQRQRPDQPDWAAQTARPPQRDQRPDWARPNEDPGYLVIDDPTMPQDDTDEGESLEHADWLRRMAEVMESAEGQHGHEGLPGEGFGEPEPIGSIHEGLSSEIGGSASGRSSPSLATGTVGQGMDPWDGPVYGGARAKSGMMPPALAHLDRYGNPVAQGVVWAEVLGKPVSKRRGRGRNGI